MARPLASARTTNASPFASSGPLAAACRFFFPALRVSLAMAPSSFCRDQLANIASRSASGTSYRLPEGSDRLLDDERRGTVVLLGEAGATVEVALLADDLVAHLDEVVLGQLPPGDGRRGLDELALQLRHVERRQRREQAHAERVDGGEVALQELGHLRLSLRRPRVVVGVRRAGQGVAAGVVGSLRTGDVRRPGALEDAGVVGGEALALDRRHARDAEPLARGDAPVGEHARVLVALRELGEHGEGALRRRPTRAGRPPWRRPWRRRCPWCPGRGRRRGGRGARSASRSLMWQLEPMSPMVSNSTPEVMTSPASSV